MLPGVHGGIEHTVHTWWCGRIILCSSDVCSYITLLCTGTRGPLLSNPSLLLHCFSLALASFFRFCFCHFFFFPLMYCRVDYLVPYNIRTHFFVKYAHTDTRVHSHFSNILNNKKIFLIFKKTHKVPVQYYLFLKANLFFFLYFHIFLFSSTASPFSPSFFSLFVWVDFVRLRHFF